MATFGAARRDLARQARCGLAGRGVAVAWCGEAGRATLGLVWRGRAMFGLAGAVRRDKTG